MSDAFWIGCVVAGLGLATMVCVCVRMGAIAHAFGKDAGLAEAGASDFEAVLRAVESSRVLRACARVGFVAGEAARERHLRCVLGAMARRLGPSVGADYHTTPSRARVQVALEAAFDGPAENPDESGHCAAACYVWAYIHGRDPVGRERFCAFVRRRVSPAGADGFAAVVESAVPEVGSARALEVAALVLRAFGCRPRGA
jgi:hypothetical protein